MQTVLEPAGFSNTSAAWLVGDLERNPELGRAILEYLGGTATLRSLDLLRSTWSSHPTYSSQLYHLDGDATPQVKVMVFCSDVTMESGPLTVLDADISKRIQKQLGYKTTRRLTDEQVLPAVGTPLLGPAGTVALVDTSRCFHYGSRVVQGAERLVAVYQWVRA